MSRCSIRRWRPPHNLRLGSGKVKNYVVKPVLNLEPYIIRSPQLFFIRVRSLGAGRLTEALSPTPVARQHEIAQVNCTGCGTRKIDKVIDSVYHKRSYAIPLGGQRGRCEGPSGRIKVPKDASLCTMNMKFTEAVLGEIRINLTSSEFSFWRQRLLSRSWTSSRPAGGVHERET